MAFLLQTLKMKKSPHKWNDWIMKTISSGRVAVKVNGEICPYFRTHQGLRQGDPLSPLLFDLVVDVLAILVGRAVDQGLLTGLAKDQAEGDVVVLQYADDTILLFQDDLEQARNLKRILGMFEIMSGLKVNFHKSEVVCVWMEEERIKLFQEIFTCGRGKFPIKYLGIPVDEKMLKTEIGICWWGGWKKRMGGWLGRLLNIAGRTSLVNSSLSSLALYMFYPFMNCQKVSRRNMTGLELVFFRV